jgi:phospholipase C
VQAVLDALTANPEVWSKTVLLVNYDENDGFFDHMPSPAVPSRNADGSLAGGHTLAAADVAVEYHDFAPATSSQPAADGRPYGPGPRVPMWVVSPWSRGGWVNSQVFDHTSTLLFLEKRFGVVEPQISAYRRAVCGDLTSAFNFRTPNDEPLPTLAGRTTKSAADALSAAQQAAPKITPPATPSLPAQAVGVRPSRALPYELHASAHVDGGNGTVTLKFANTGRAAAVFHVYDKLHLDRVPRRYVVEPGKRCAATGPHAPTTPVNMTSGCSARTAITAASPAISRSLPAHARRTRRSGSATRARAATCICGCATTAATRCASR